MRSPYGARKQIGASIVKDMYGRLLREGVSELAILQATGLQPDACNDPDARFPAAMRQRLWQLAIEAFPRPDLGLHWARDVRPQDIGVAGYIALNSLNLGLACQALGRFGRLICEDDRFASRQEGEVRVLSYELEDAAPSCHRQIVENVLACICVIMRGLAGAEIRPREVRLRFPPPADMQPYRELFGSPVLFDQSENALLFHLSVYTLTLPTANQYLHRILSQHAQSQLEQMPAEFPTSWRERVRIEIIRRIHAGQVRIADLAPSMRVSARTLQRRLTEEGCALSDLVTEIQRDMAMDYLAMPHVSLTEIAALLGFSEASAFHRAFKRWYGISPGGYRREQATGKPRVDVAP